MLSCSRYGHDDSPVHQTMSSTRWNYENGINHRESRPTTTHKLWVVLSELSCLRLQITTNHIVMYAWSWRWWLKFVHAWQAVAGADSTSRIMFSIKGVWFCVRASITPTRKNRTVTGLLLSHTDPRLWRLW